MPLRFDHAFVFVPPTAARAAATRLTAAGLVEGPPNVHPGQGTRNRRFYFDNGMLELLWVHDEDEARHPRTARTGLWERSRWTELGTCPFGIAWAREGDDDTVPVATWPYRPVYLPPELSIAVAVASDDPGQPFGFVMPGRRRPSTAPRTARPIHRLTVQHPALDPTWARLGDAASILHWTTGPPCMSLVLGGPPADRPSAVDLHDLGVPLVLGGHAA